MYVSRAVRSIRDDPIDGESVGLVLEPDDETDPDAVAAAARAADATVKRRLQFGELEVRVPHQQVDDVCAIDGLAAVETTNAIGIHPDKAEEDIDQEG